MNRVILICESIEDAKYLLKNMDIIPHPIEKVDILSAFPEIKSILYDSGIITKTTAEFINLMDYEIINADCERLYSELESQLKLGILSKYKHCFTNMFLYYTYFALYTIIWNARLLQNLLDLRQYDKIITIKPHNRVVSSPWFISEQNILHLLLSQVICHKQIEHIVLNRVEISNKSGDFRKFILVAIRILIQPLYKKLLKNIFSGHKSTFKVMVPTVAKNMDILCSNIIKKCPDTVYFYFGEGKTVLSELNNLYILIKYFLIKKGVTDLLVPEAKIIKISLSVLSPIWREEKSHFTADIFKNTIYDLTESEVKLNILKSAQIINFLQHNKIQHILSYLDYHQFLSLGLEKLFDFCKLDFIVSQMSLGVTCVFGFLAQMTGVPSMLISHGSHILHTDRVANLEHELIANNMLFGGYRYLGIQTTFAMDFVLKKNVRSQSIVKIKPSILLNNYQKNKKKDSKLTILHAGTIKDGTKRHLYETPDEILETFQEIIELISTCENLRLIIKFRQIESFSFKALKILLEPLPKNVSLVSEGAFGEYLSSAHLLMSFSSTTIEEALINNTPILLYGGKGRYSHIPNDTFKFGTADSIMNTVTFVDNRESLTTFFKILDEHYAKHLDHQFDFSSYQLNESVEVVDWLEQNNILKQHL
jgi:hypothetical protein